MTIICDIDGTLADSQHRFVNFSTPLTTEDWLLVHDPRNILNDPPIVSTWEKVTALQLPVSFITGRSERIRDVTKRWLDHYCVEYRVQTTGHLLMRADGDWRTSPRVKWDLLTTLRRAGVHPTIVFEDNIHDAQMYDNEGLKNMLTKVS